MKRRPRRPLLTRLVLFLMLLTTAGVGARLHAQEPELAPALLDGVLLPAEEAAFVNSLLPVAVMVDNYIDARPQIGLDRADLVYELLVEGGITRFMAVYLRQEADWVEPVRSARTPFLFVARELGAVLGHVGAAGTEGPSDAQTQFSNWGVLHLDEQFNPGPFWRDRARAAPYNAATSITELRGHALGLGWLGPSEMQPWLFKEDGVEANASGGAVSALSYAFFWGGPPLSDFAADWFYDAGRNEYARSTAGRPHIDGRSGARLTARNVVVQFDTAGVINREGHVLYGSVGVGPAYVFLDGQVIEATWSKPSLEQRNRYVDLNGEEIKFNRGNTWIAVLPEGSPLGWR